VSFYDCTAERIYTNAEINILRSCILMIVNAIEYRRRAEKIRDPHDYFLSLLDTMPFACAFFDKHCNMLNWNRESAKLFGLDDKIELLHNFYDFSPKYQPDGQPSRTKALNYLKIALEEGKCQFEWVAAYTLSVLRQG